MIKVDFEVKSYDTNPRSTLRISSLMKAMQQAAREDCDKIGSTYEAMKNDGVVFVVARNAIKLNRPIKCGEIITMETWQHKVKGVSFFRNFEFFVGEENVGCAVNQWVLMDIEKGRIARPDVLTKKIPDHDREIDLEIDTFRIKKDESDSKSEFKVLYSMLDQNDHLNNCIYVDIVDDYCKEHKDTNLIDLHYVSEMKLGELGEVNYWYNENGYDSVITRDGKNVFEVKVKYFD